MALAWKVNWLENGWINLFRVCWQCCQLLLWNVELWKQKLQRTFCFTLTVGNTLLKSSTNEMKWKETGYRPDVCHWELSWKNWGIVLSGTVWLKLTNSWQVALLTFFPKRLFPKILLRSEVQWFQQYCLHNSIGHLNGYRVEHPNQLFFSKILSAKEMIQNVLESCQ